MVFRGRSRPIWPLRLGIITCGEGVLKCMDKAPGSILNAKGKNLSDSVVAADLGMLVPFLAEVIWGKGSKAVETVVTWV